MPAPRILAYPMNAVVAEKLEAVFSLGMLNSLMKDFYDIWFLAGTFPFEARALASAIGATFGRRKTPVSSEGLNVLLQQLSNDDGKHTQWRAFLRKSGLAAPEDFASIGSAIAAFVLLPIGANGAENQAEASWPAGGPWISS